MKHNAKTNTAHIIIEIGDYVVVRTHAKRSHKLQSLRRGQMRVTQERRLLLFEVENINDRSEAVAHAQRLLPYPATRRVKQASAESKRKSENYDSQYYVVESIGGNRKKEDRHEVMEK